MLTVTGVIAGLVIAGAAPPAQTQDIAAIQQAIGAAGADWVAGPNWTTELAPSESRLLLGWDYASEPEPIHVPPPAVPQTQPAYLDWRDYEGQNYVTPVKDQASCGSCWAFGGVGALESRLAIEAGVADPTLDLSEQYLVSCATNNGCNGYSIEGTLSFLQSDGALDEVCMPYEASDAVPCSDHCSDAQFRTWYAQSWAGTGGTVEGMKAALMQGPIVVGFIVYQDFNSYTSGVYEHVWGDVSGGHAVTLVGWDDSLSCWICKNSWGGSWGEQGYFRIRWGQCGLEPWSFWVVPAPQEYPRLSVARYDISADQGDGDLVANPGELVDVVVTLRNALIWHDATSVSGMLATQDEGIQILQSQATFGDIAAGEEASNTSYPFVVRIDEDRELGDATLELHCMSADGGGDLYQVEIPIKFKVSLDQYGWPMDLGCAVTSSPLVAELEQGKGTLVSFADDAGGLHLVQPDGQEASGFPVDVGDLVRGAVAAGDLDGDGAAELVLGTRSSEIWAVKADGTPLFVYTAPGRIGATPALGDLDNDGLLEVVVATVDGDLLALKYDGTLAPGFPVDIGEQVIAGATLADLDSDGSTEIILGTLGSRVHILSSDGHSWPAWPRTVSGKIWASPTVADLDGNGGWELLVGTHAGYLHALGGGGEKWTVELGSWIRTSPGVVDLDRDGKLEVIAGTDAGYIHVLDASGAVFPGNWPVELGGRIETSPVVADMDGDGLPEIVSGSVQGQLWVFDHEGDVVSPFPAPAPGAVRSSPCVLDMDADGDLEIAVGTASGAWVIDVKDQGGTTEGYWSMFRGRPTRDGVSGGGFITSAPDGSVADMPGGYRLLGPAPNPSRDEVALAFETPRPTWVTMRVFNAAGQVVSHLHDGLLPAGSHRMVWGTQEVPPGRYVYRVQSPDYVGSGTVVVIR
jgi:hypothetical protein